MGRGVTTMTNHQDRILNILFSKKYLISNTTSCSKQECRGDIAKFTKEPSKRIQRRWGRAQSCTQHAPAHATTATPPDTRPALSPCVGGRSPSPYFLLYYIILQQQKLIFTFPNRIRVISTSRLNALLRVHLKPINVIISYDP